MRNYTTDINNVLKVIWLNSFYAFFYVFKNEGITDRWADLFYD